MDKPRNLAVRQLFPAPTPAAPERMRCVSVYIPDSMDHLAAFAGALALLGKWNSWQKDDAHSARLAALAWQQCNMLGIRDCETNDFVMGIDLGDDMGQNIRKKPENPCIIQMWCIDHWEDWYDPLNCIAGTIEQPTDGTPLADGECREWDVSLAGNEKWLLPVAVNEGDTISVTAASGAWNDGGLGWNCVDGHTYALGACVSADAPDIGDPLQTVDHMRLIMNIDGSWYDAYNSITATPPGTADGQVYFQCNDGTLDSNSGRVSFHLKLCKQNPVATPIDITYTDGSGPASCNSGDIIAISAIDTAPTHNWYVFFAFSREVRVTVLSVGAFILNPAFGAGTNFGHEKNNAGTVLQNLTVGTDTSPLDYVARDNVKTFDAGAAYNAWTLTIKVEDF